MDHRQRNRATCAPNPRKLNKYVIVSDDEDGDRNGNNYQINNSNKIGEDEEGEEDGEGEDDEDETAMPVHHGSKRIGQGSADPRNLCHYHWDPALKLVIIDAMNRFRIHITMELPFPTAGEDKEAARIMLEEAIADAVAEKRLNKEPCMYQSHFFLFETKFYILLAYEQLLSMTEIVCFFIILEYYLTCIYSGLQSGVQPTKHIQKSRPRCCYSMLY